MKGHSKDGPLTAEQGLDRLGVHIRDHGPQTARVVATHIAPEICLDEKMSFAKGSEACIDLAFTGYRHGMWTARNEIRNTRKTVVIKTILWTFVIQGTALAVLILSR